MYRPVTNRAQKDDDNDLQIFAPKRRLLNRPQPAVYLLLHSLGQQCRDMVERVAVLGAPATLKSGTKTAKPEEVCRVRHDNAERNS